MKGGCLALALLLLASGIAAETDLNSAVAIANAYKHVGEHTSITPQHQVDGFWPIELVSSTNQIVTIMPVSVADGSVTKDDAARSVQKTHYLANFFATHESIESFVDDAQGTASSMQAQLQEKDDRLETDIKPGLTVTISSLPSYESALGSAISDSESIRDSALGVKDSMKAINTEADIASCQSAFTSFFAQQNALIGSLKALKTRASDVREEINTMITEGTIDQSYGLGLSNEFVLSGIDSTIISMEDQTRENEGAISGFFASLDGTVDEYYRVLDQRISEKGGDAEKQALWDRYENLTARYNALLGQTDSIPPAQRSKVNTALEMLEAAAASIEEGDYDGAGASLSDATDEIRSVEAQVGKWPPECVGGTVWTGSSCACPAGTVSDGSKCNAKGGTGINMTIVGGAVILLILVAGAYFYFKGRKGNAETEEPAAAAGWSQYKF